MLNLMQRGIIQNFQTICKSQVARASYQFRIAKPVYYPNRATEMQRTNSQMKTQLVSEKQEVQRLSKDDYYKLLGISRYATTQQIKSAYYALAKRYHPDAKISSDRKTVQHFEAISNAYHILTDEAKRLEYDQLGMVKDEQTFLKQATTLREMRNKNVKARIENIVAPVNKNDLINMGSSEPTLELTFLEAIHGAKKNINMRYMRKCPTCNGKSQKLASYTNLEPCRKCQGTGQISRKTATYASTNVCTQCMGKRFINRNQCDTCESRGFVSDTVQLFVHVPTGVRTGDKLPVENPKNKQRINYRVNVKESSNYTRNGNDIYSDKYLTISEAIFGGTFKVRGIYEDFEVCVAPGTESHSKIVCKHKGIRSREGTGDHYITFKIRLPHSLSMKQRQLMLAWAKTEDPTFEQPP